MVMLTIITAIIGLIGLYLISYILYLISLCIWALQFSIILEPIRLIV